MNINILKNYYQHVQKIKSCTNLKNAKLEFQTKYLLKPLSFWVSPFCIYLGLTAHKVTFLRLLISLIACFSYALWFYQGYSIVCPMLFFLVFLLDQVDGNLVRFQNNSDWSGKFMDGAVDISFENFTPFFIGWATYNQTGQYLYWIIASATAILGMQFRFFSERRKRVTLKMYQGNGHLTNKTVGSPIFLRRIKSSFMDPLMRVLPFARKYLLTFSLVVLTAFPAKILFYILIPATILCFILQTIDLFLVVFTKLNFHRVSGLAQKNK